MLKKKLFLTERVQDKFSCLSSPLLSKTLNIYTKAINWSLCTSSRCHARPFPSVNSPCRILNLEGFCWQRGYRNPFACSSYKKSYQRFLEALHLCVLMRKKGGEIYVLFDGAELRPPSRFLDPQRLSKKFISRGLKSNAMPDHELSPCPVLNRPMLREPRVMSDLKCKPYMAQKASTQKNPFYFFPNLLKNRAKYETVYSWSGEKWVGGTFSNFKQVSKNINLYKTLSRQFLEILEKQTSPRYFVIAKKFHGNLCSRLCKKSTSTFLHRENLEPRPQELNIKSLKKKNLPDLIIIENAERYRNVIAEAESLKIPVIAFVESDILSNISIALPLNALKHYFLAFLLHIVYKI